MHPALDAEQRARHPRVGTETVDRGAVIGERHGLDLARVVGQPAQAAGSTVHVLDIERVGGGTDTGDDDIACRYCELGMGQIRLADIFLQHLEAGSILVAEQEQIMAAQGCAGNLVFGQRQLDPGGIAVDDFAERGRIDRDLVLDPVHDDADGIVRTRRDDDEG